MGKSYLIRILRIWVGGDGLTLVELVIVMVVSGIMALTAPSLLFHGVKTMVFLPKALLVNHAATEIMHQIIEGGFSTLAGQTTVRGVRFAVRRSATEPALWLATDDCVGFRASSGQDVVIWWDQTANQEAIRRVVVTAGCPFTCSTAGGEFLPYDAQGRVRVVRIAPATPIFRYYNQSDTLLSAPGCSVSGIITIRRAELAFVAQTGNGNFDEGQAKEQVTSSVAIRVP